MNEYVSVVVPCRNEENYIEQCVDSILSQNYPRIEVLVVDGSSEDNTRNVLKKYATDQRFRLLDNPKRVTPIALNLGIEAAKGDVVIIFGAHAEMLPDYIERCMETFRRDSQLGCVGGTLHQLHENKKAYWISKAMSSPFGVGNAHFRTGFKSGYVDTVAFGAYKKEVFEKIGLFDTALVRNQDDELNFRVIQADFKIYLNHEIESNYFVRSSFSKLFKQYFQYGYWKVFVNKKHKTVTTWRQVVPAIFVAALVVGFILSLLSTSLGKIYSLGIATYFLAAIYFALQKSKNIKNVFGILWSFLLLHIGYGSGYWKGLIEFILLRRKVISSSQTELTR